MAISGIAGTITFSIILCNIFIVILVINFLIEQIRTPRFWKISYLFLLPIVYFLFHILSLAYTENLSQGVFILEKRASLLALPLIIGSAAYKIDPYKVAKNVFLFSIVGIIIYLLIYCPYNAYFRQNDPFNWRYYTYSNLAGYFNSHPTFAGWHFCFSLAIILSDSLLKNRSLINFRFYLNLLFLLLVIILILLLSSRISILCSILILAFFTIREIINGDNQLKKILLVFLTVILLMFLFAIPTASNRFKNMFRENLSNGTPVDRRINHLEVSLEIIKNNVFVGVGVGDVQNEMDKLYLKRGLKGLIGYNPHNQYILTVLGLGISGLVVLILIIISTMFYSLKYKKTQLTVFIFLFIIFSLTESTLASQKGVVFFSLFYSLLIYRINDNDNLKLD